MNEAASRYLQVSLGVYNTKSDLNERIELRMSISIAILEYCKYPRMASIRNIENVQALDVIVVWLM